MGYQSGFEEPDIEKRTEPKLLLENAESIISIAIAYPSKMKNAPQGKKGARRGIFVVLLGESIIILCYGEACVIGGIYSEKVPEC